MPVNDLAGAEYLAKGAPEQIFAGEAPIITDSAPALATIVKYQVCALTATGITPYVVATHTGQQIVVSAQAAPTGDNCPYYEGGAFNHAMLVWPAELDTLPKRKALAQGTMVKLRHLLP